MHILGVKLFKKEMLPIVLRRLIRSPAYFLFRLYVRLRCWQLDKMSSLLSNSNIQIPPALMRFRVSENVSSDVYLEVGKRSLEHIESVLVECGKSLSEAETILDFGCGCGRTLVWLKAAAYNARLFGTDVDQDAIAWGSINLPGVTLCVNGAIPPLPFDTESIDLVYSVSVFTHLDNDLQSLWLKELHRITKTGGTVILTLHGESTWSDLPTKDQAELAYRGFLFKKSSKLKGLLPDWYHTAYHSETFVRHQVSTLFTVVKYKQRGFGYQDIVVLVRQA